MSAEGAIRFARFAHPPNALGYCGPSDDASVRRLAVTPALDAPAVDEAEVLALARGFEGAWPYLELLAGPTGDPLSVDVVDAYWLGGGRADEVAADAFATHLRDRVGDRLGVPWPAVEAAIAAGGRPTHAFHVLCASPFVGLARRGAIAAALPAIEGCRISWGEVRSVEGTGLVVDVVPLEWEAGVLRLDGARLRARTAVAAGGAPALSAGDRVALHWDRVCDRLEPERWARLEATTHEHLEVVERLGPVDDRT